MAAILLLIGDSRVGTTTLVKGFLTPGKSRVLSTPDGANSSTVRHLTEVYSDIINMPTTVQIVDVHGADVESALLSANKAHAVAVVYDVSNRSSFELAQSYLDDVNPRASALLIGNKTDLEEYRKVSSEEGRLLAKIHRVYFIETCAKDQRSVDMALRLLVGSVPPEYLILGNKHKAVRRWHVGTAVVQVCTSCRQHMVQGATKNRTVTAALSTLPKSPRLPEIEL